PPVDSAMPTASTSPRPRIPRSARSPSTAGPACSFAWEMRVRGKRCRGSRRPSLLIPPRQPRCTCSGTCSRIGGTGPARRVGSVSSSPVIPPTCAPRWRAFGSPRRHCATACATAPPPCSSRKWRRQARSAPPRGPRAPGWGDGLAARGFGPAAVRLGWQAALKSPNDSRVLRVIFPWPNRRAVEAEAAEFGVDPLLLVAIVRQESVFDAQALSPAGARGLAQLLPGTAALTARGLDVTFYPDWITVPDLNLHLGAAHLQELLQRFGGRVDAAAAAYNAGSVPVKRWLERPGADDPDEFIQLIPHQETRGYVRAVLRNRELYRALYVSPTN